MRRKIVLTLLIFWLSGLAKPVFCEAPMVSYLCELGIAFYRIGRYDDALLEFQKALILDPDNSTAKKYINDVFKREIKQKRRTAKLEIEPLSQEKAAREPTRLYAPEEAMEETLESLAKKDLQEKLEKKPVGKTAVLKISGETQVRLGITSRDTIWKQANFDLTEKNWRTISSAALNQRENTYDAKTYSRLDLNLDTDNEEGFGFHSNITVDPWSFTGKSSKITLQRDGGGDAAEVELKYWANTGYTVNETINTLQKGDAISLPEIKVESGHITTPVRITNANNWAGNVYTFTISDEIKIHREFQPLREFWFDYKQENLKLRIYPLAYENQALTFDDPLRLSNNRMWWEESPWIRGWKHGQYNSGASPVDFTKGYWDNTLSFSIKDSEGQRLTALRGFSFAFKPQEATSIETSVATAKTLWQDYSDVDNLISATRLKQSLAENLNLGLTATTRTGYNLDDKNRIDARNYVVGTDLGYEIIDGLKANLEVANSQSRYDLTNAQYRTKSGGFAYYFSILGRFPFRSIMDTENAYDGIQPEKDERSFTKFRLFACRMDDSFDPSLSSYVETRDDEWWSRHIHFRQPFKYYYEGEGRLLSWDDVKTYGVGNGIDIGRSSLGLRVESLLWDRKIGNLFDVRNVHEANGKFVENVSREELTWNITDKLTTKLLGIYHRLPDTHKGVDPYYFDPRTRRFFTNDEIEDDKDPSVATGSLGLEYKFFDWLALNGIWEYTNDLSLGLDNFPRTILKNDTMRAYTFYEDYNKYRDYSYSLWSQQYFPKPPYPYHNVFKTGLSFKPIEKLEFYLDYTRNPYEKAGLVDDNMNHIGLQVAYSPTPKLGLFLKHTYSRWQDLDSISQGITKVTAHHNFFSELIYRKSEDEDFTLQYGEANRNPYMGEVLDMGWDPFGGSLRTIDTQHIFRLYYRRKF